MKVSDVLKTLTAQLGREASHADLAAVFNITRSAVTQWSLDNDDLPIRRELELRLHRPDLVPDASVAASPDAAVGASCSENG